ncbi:hypothetical protein [Streptomyces sp. BK340]|uniref:hypothetical protein n=1 Tax=Streptomyces sp. BK340 TaxID=2572903 RepID=UPI0021BD6294|nr:hypothetical protein [Streptomyces sp. BK340]
MASAASVPRTAAFPSFGHHGAVRLVVLAGPEVVGAEQATPAMSTPRWVRTPATPTDPT